METKELAKDAPATATAPAPEPKPLAKVRVNAVAARIAATCMAKFDIRYYLNGLLVEPRAEGGVYVVGTDGHRMCVVIDADGEASEPTILRVQPLVSKLPKPGAKAIHYPDQYTLHLEHIGTRPVLELKDNLGRSVAMCGDAVVEGKFPAWRGVIPSDWSKLKRQTLNLYRNEYVQDTWDLLAKREGIRRSYPFCYQEEKDRAMLWHFSSYDHVLLIVMPLRDAGEPPPLDDWQANFWPSQFQARPKKDKARKTAKA